MRTVTTRIPVVSRILAVALGIIVIGATGSGLAQIASASPQYQANTKVNAAKVIVKTIDANGKVTYSDRIVDGDTQVRQRSTLKSTGEEVITRAGSAPAAPMAPESAKPASPTPTLSAEQAAAKVAALNCTTSRKNLESVNSGKRVVRVGDNGEVVPLSDEQIAAERARIEGEVTQYCGNK